MAAPMWRGVVDEYINGMSDNSAPDLVNELQKNNVTLLKVVESIGPSLTSPEASARARAVRLLADIVHGLESQSLTQKEVDLLVTYMVEKLKDHHSIQPHALYGVLTLSAGGKLKDEAVVNICRVMFAEVYTQSLAQADRRNVYQILLNFLHNHTKVVAGLGGEFVHGFIQAMDMEKDPRNLVLAFQCVSAICQHVPLGVFVEEMFEVFSCYFPVDFTPPPDDVFAITREDLVIGLQRCMSASPKFAPFCLPLILEKITSDLNSAKIDAFNALIACCGGYGASELEEFLGSLFTAIKREVFSSGDETVEDSALNSLTAIVRTLSSAVSERGSRSSMDGFLETVLKDSEAALPEPRLRQFPPTARLLQSVAGSCDPAYCKVLHAVMPTLLHQLQSNTQDSQRLPVLDVIQNFLKLSKNFSYTSDVAHPIRPYADQLFELLCEFLGNTSTQLRLQAVTCLTAMLCVGVLGENCHEVVAGHLALVSLKDADETVREAGTSGLGCLGRTSPAVVISSVLPSIRDRLQPHPDSMEVDGRPTNVVSQADVLNTLVSISTHEDIVLQVIPLVVSFLSQIAQDRCTLERQEDAVAASRCLNSLLRGHTESPLVLQHYATETVPGLIHSTVLHSLHTVTPSVMHSEAVVTQIAHIVRLLTTKLTESDAVKLCDGVVGLFVEGRLPPAIKEQVEQCPQAFQPLQVSSPWQQTQLICILMAVVTSLHKEARLKQEAEIIERLTDLSLRSDHSFTSTSAAMFLSGMINKTQDGEDLVCSIGKLKDRLMTLLTSESVKSEKQRALTAWLWLTKALVLRGHALAVELVNQLLTWFENTEFGAEAAKGFEVILGDSTQVLTTPQHANIRLMYKQRMFMEYLPRLVSGFSTTQSDCKKHYLVALSHLANCVPTQVLLSEVNNLLPLLIHSLLSGDSELQESTLSTLCVLLTEIAEAVSKHVDSLIPQLLSISCSANAMKTRIAALKCLGLLSSLTPHVILPYKKRVIRDLEPALDDRKRLVRRQAVRTRGEWFLLGAPVKS